MFRPFKIFNNFKVHFDSPSLYTPISLATMGRGSKFQGPAPVGQSQKTPSTSAPAASVSNGSKSSKANGISDELRRAVLDLGGGEEDFELIEGVDDDEDDSAPVASGKSKSKEGDVSCLLCGWDSLVLLMVE